MNPLPTVATHDGTRGVGAALPRYIGEAIRRATGEVFSMMLGERVEPGEMTVHKAAQPGQPDPESYHPGVVAVLGMTGEWAGSGQLSCAPEFACRIASWMLGDEYAVVDEDVLDAVAEVANMIVGNVKNMLEDRLGPMALSTPTIVFGPEFATRIAGNPDRVMVPFRCGGERMAVQVVLAPKHTAGGEGRHGHGHAHGLVLSEADTVSR